MLRKGKCWIYFQDFFLLSYAAAKDIFYQQTELSLQPREVTEVLQLLQAPKWHAEFIKPQQHGTLIPAGNHLCLLKYNTLREDS